MELEHVNGENKGDILLFALSTCGWCKKTREHLEKLNLEYDFLLMYLLELVQFVVLQILLIDHKVLRND